MKVSVTLPLRIESGNIGHGREHWAKRARRVKRERLAAIAVPKFTLPATVTLTRIAPRTLDGDNLEAGFKGLRDGIADRAGVDDRDPRITWLYAQERGKPKQQACRVDVHF